VTYVTQGFQTIERVTRSLRRGPDLGFQACGTLFSVFDCSIAPPAEVRYVPKYEGQQPSVPKGLFAL